MWGHIAGWWSKKQEDYSNLTPVQIIRKQLELCQYQSNKLQRISMLYAELIQGLKKQIADFKISTQVPIELGDNKNRNQLSLSIIGNIKISTQKIKCNLELIVWFDKAQQLIKPIYFIRNPDGSKYKPNVKFQKIYQWVIGGVKVIEIAAQNKIDWTRYHKSHLLKQIKNIIQQISKYFPFVAMRQNKGQIQLDKIGQLIKKIKQNGNQQQMLQDVQTLLILQKSIESEQKNIQTQNNKLKEIIKIDSQQQQKANKIWSLIQPQTPKDQALLNLLSQHKAIIDTQMLLQQKFQSQMSNSEDKQKVLKNYMQLVGSFAGKKFQLSYMIEKIKRQKQSQQ